MGIIVEFLGNNLPVVGGLLYMIIKTVLRILIHKLSEENNRTDYGATYVWSTVDLCLLGISVAVSTNFMKKHTYEMTAAFYMVSVAFLILSCIMYGLFIKTRLKLKGHRSPLSNLHLGFLLTASSFFGVSPYVFVLNKLVV